MTGEGDISWYQEATLSLTGVGAWLAGTGGGAGVLPGDGADQVSVCSILDNLDTGGVIVLDSLI